MVKQFRCCFPECKFKHPALIVVINHLTKKHKLRINKDGSIIPDKDIITVVGFERFKQSEMKR